MYVEGDGVVKCPPSLESWHGVGSRHLCILLRIEILISWNMDRSDTPTARLKGVFGKVELGVVCNNVFGNG